MPPFGPSLGSLLAAPPGLGLLMAPSCLMAYRIKSAMSLCLQAAFAERICMLMMMLYFPFVDACLITAHVGEWKQLCLQLPQLCSQFAECLQPYFGSMHSAPGPSLRVHQRNVQSTLFVSHHSLCFSAVP